MASRPPLRVARVITRLNIGGPSYHVALLAAGLHQHGYQTDLLAGTPDKREGDMSDYALGLGIQPLAVPGLGRNPHPHADLQALLWLFGHFIRTRPTIVHSHQSKAGALARVAARLARVPVVAHTFHGSGFGVFSNSRVRASVIAAERFLARLSTVLIVLGDKQLEDYLAAGIAPRSKLRVVPLGLDLTPFEQAGQHRGQLRAELGIPPDAPVIGVASRLVAIKGVDGFIRAAAALSGELPEAHWIVAGDGDARPDLERLAAEVGLPSRLHFLGWRRDLPRVYADLDLMVLPTVMDFEGTPVAVIEAMAAGVPIVATDVGGVSQLVRQQETGVLVPAQSVDALMDAIRALLADRQLAQRLAQQGRQLALSRHRGTRLVEDVSRVYAQVLEAQGLPPAH